MENPNNVEILNSPDRGEDYTIKFVVIGDSGVGKSNILSRLCHGVYNQDSKATVGCELTSKCFKIKDSIVRASIWDTAGQERYNSITAAYYKGAKGAMIVYDVTKPDTFNNIDKWYKEIKELGEKDVSIMLVGNKNDLREIKAVDYKQACQKAELLKVPIMETSALDNENIGPAFITLVNGNYF